MVSPGTIVSHVLSVGVSPLSYAFNKPPKVNINTHDNGHIDSIRKNPGQNPTRTKAHRTKPHQTKPHSDTTPLTNTNFGHNPTLNLIIVVLLGL